MLYIVINVIVLRKRDFIINLMHHMYINLTYILTYILNYKYTLYISGFAFALVHIYGYELIKIYLNIDVKLVQENINCSKAVTEILLQQNLTNFCNL